VRRFLVTGLLASVAVLSAESPFFLLKDVRAGMRGVGRTVFSGDQIEEFQVEVLGVLDNFGPKESLILARLSGGPLEHTGILQGMSGSPVYLEGKLAGAVAMAFPFAKDPIAGIRPIEEMVRPASGLAAAPRRLALDLAALDLTRPISRPRSVMTGEARLMDIATPVSFGGFSQATLDAFAPQLRSLGLEPRQAISAGSKIDLSAVGDASNLKPGSMISVQLLSGDFTVAADGTVTYIEGNRIYAFGHRFLDVGATSLPFARAEVVTLVPNLNASFKLSMAREWMGVINEDRDTVVAGELGRRADLAPVTIAVRRGGRPVQNYELQMVKDPLLSPLLLQMAVYSAIDATERTVGAATIRVTGEAEFQNAPSPIQLDNMFSGDNGSAMQVSISTAVPIAYVMQSGFRSLDLKRIAIRIDTYDEKKQLSIENVTVSRREARAGDSIVLNILMTGENGLEVTRRVVYHVPPGAEPGMLYFTVADATVTNLSDFRPILSTTPRSASQIISTVNSLHPNTKAYVRIWRPNPAYQLEGADLPDPPASVSLILSSSQASLAGVMQTRNAKVGQIEIDGGGMVISGAKTVQVEIKE
jgi:hypothetical protein